MFNFWRFFFPKIFKPINREIFFDELKKHNPLPAGKKRKSDSIIEPEIVKKTKVSNDDEIEEDSTMKPQVGKKGLAGPKCWKEKQKEKEDEALHKIRGTKVRRRRLIQPLNRRYNFQRQYVVFPPKRRLAIRRPKDSKKHDTRLSSHSLVESLSGSSSRSQSPSPSLSSITSPGFSPVIPMNRSVARSPDKPTARPPARPPANSSGQTQTISSAQPPTSSSIQQSTNQHVGLNTKKAASKAADKNKRSQKKFETVRSSPISLRSRKHLS